MGISLHYQCDASVISKTTDLGVNLCFSPQVLWASWMNKSHLRCLKTKSLLQFWIILLGYPQYMDVDGNNVSYFFTGVFTFLKCIFNCWFFKLHTLYFLKCILSSDNLKILAKLFQCIFFYLHYSMWKSEIAFASSHQVFPSTDIFTGIRSCFNYWKHSSVLKTHL